MSKVDDFRGEIDDTMDQLDLIKYDIKNMRKEFLGLLEQSNQIIQGIIKGCKLLEKALQKNTENVERVVKNQQEIVKFLDKRT